MMHEPTDKDLKALIEETKRNVNMLWKEAHLGKFIQWGKDAAGNESVHALNGPALKGVLRDPTLLKVTIELMRPVYASLEAKKVIKIGADGLPEKIEKPPKKKKGVRRRRRRLSKAPARASNFDDIITNEP